LGEWEINTIVGKENKGDTLTVTERKNRFLLMRNLPERKITSDNGTEFYE
jgi:IS30 family transposase